MMVDTADLRRTQRVRSPDQGEREIHRHRQMENLAGRPDTEERFLRRRRPILRSGGEGDTRVARLQ